MTSNLKNKRWKEFVLNDLFSIKSTSSSIDRNKLNNKTGKIPYITRSDRDNGCDDFIAIQDSKYKLDKSNVITIGLDTQTIFYQPHPFYTGQNIQILESKFLNKNVAYFIMPLIKRQMEKFNWGGNGATLTRLKRQKILLPITPSGKLDYKYMEDYVKTLEEQKKKQYLDYIAKRIEKVKGIKAPLPLRDKEWKSFRLTDFFTFEKGDQNNMASIKGGNIPLVSAKKNGNGYKNFASQTNKKLYKGNSLTLNNDGDGGAGISYYQPYKYLLDSHVTALYPINYLNRFVLLFISKCVTLQRNKFGHGYSINNDRLKVFKIMLPVNSESGVPDYDYMEQYMKYLEYKKIRAYLEFKKKRI